MPASEQPALARRARHDPALDGVRGLAILIVMLHHHTVMRGLNLFDFTASTIFHLGGVGLFFVLSGYLITGILMDSKGGDGYFRSFYARRMLRIFPLYYAVVIFALVVLPRFAHAKMDHFGRIAGDEWSYWVFLQNFTIAASGRFRHAILDVTWTLAIEEQFYLVWPLVVWLFSRRTLLWIAGSLVVAALAVRLVLVLGFDVNPIAIFVLTPTRMDTLAAGAWLALWARGERGEAALDRVVPWAKWVGLPAFALAAVIVTAEELRIHLVDPQYRKVVADTIGFSFWALGFASIMLLATRSRPDSRWRAFWSSRFMTTFGKYSYGLYLFHIPLRALVRDRIFGPEGTPARWHFPLVQGSELPAQILFTVVTIPLVLAAAWVSYHLWEKPFLRLKRFFPTPRGSRDGTSS